MKQEIITFANIARKFMVKNSPIILTVFGVCGLVGTAACAIEATKKSDEDLIPHVDEELNFYEKFKICWPNYIPMAVTGGMSIACIIGSNTVNMRRQAALISAYSMSESMLKEYKEKVIEKIGEKKESAIRDSIQEDKVKNNPPKEGDIIITNKGELLCMDAYSGRYFKSDIDFIKKKENEFNADLLQFMALSLNDWYDYIGLPHIKIGDQIGWSLSDEVGCSDARNLVEFRHTSHLTEDSIPCLVVDFCRYPSIDYLNY